MLVVTGIGTTIVEALKPLLPKDEDVYRPDRGVNGGAWTSDVACTDLPLDAERYLFAQGYLAGELIEDQTPHQLLDSFAVNLVSIVQMCERIFDDNDRARVCLVGSESGVKGSYDLSYALSKAALHAYVGMRKLKPEQQLVCVAPGLIWDSGMTQAREDRADLYQARKRHPKGRWLEASEVAGMVHHLLYVDRGYTTGQVIHMNGGRTRA